tara:strand:+ start:305 stop:1516 length:1212 start_codon:yes stop_codon:yes gene_type:complete
MGLTDSLSWRVVIGIEVTALVCGTVYSLTRKYMNLIEAEGLPHVTSHFRHPLYQGLFCFVGQLLAWPVWWRQQQREKRKRGIDPPVTLADGTPLLTSRRVAFLCAVPTIFDVLGTVLNNTGLILTHVSVYQMLRGARARARASTSPPRPPVSAQPLTHTRTASFARPGSVVLFTSLASKVFLKTEFSTPQVQGITLIAAGVVVIGASNTLFMERPPSVHAPWPALGNALIILSQALMAGLFVAEETLMKHERVPPFQMLGWEATIGTLLTAVLMLFALGLPGNDAGRLENCVHAYLQMSRSAAVLAAIVMMALALFCFNVTGVYITKLQSATHRACVDATRQAVVWVHALAAGWEEFLFAELLGYLLLVLGTLSFNEIIVLPVPRCPWPFRRLQKRTQYSTIG